jgi:hypothetical protein
MSGRDRSEAGAEASRARVQKVLSAALRCASVLRASPGLSSCQPVERMPSTHGRIYALHFPIGIALAGGMTWLKSYSVV